MKQKNESKRVKSALPNDLSEKRNNSFNKLVDDKTKCIEIMESRVKNYFDQKNTKKELKKFSDSILNYENSINKLKESLNSSQVSNIFEKSPLKYGEDNRSQRETRVTKDHTKKKVSFIKLGESSNQ